MNRSLAAIAAGAMLLASAPTLSFAEEASSSSSSSTSSVSSTSSSSSEDRGPSWMKPCLELKGLLKAQCIVTNNPGKGNKKDRVMRNAEDKALRLSGDCEDKEGSEKVECIRKNGRRGIKHLTRTSANKEGLRRTIRGRLQEWFDSSSSD